MDAFGTLDITEHNNDHFTMFGRTYMWNRREQGGTKWNRLVQPHAME